MEGDKSRIKKIIGYSGLCIILFITYILIPNVYDIKLKSVKLKNIEYSDDLRWSIDSININDKYTDVSGWILKPGTDSTS